jgi:hypothetical protein
MMSVMGTVTVLGIVTLLGMGLPGPHALLLLFPSLLSHCARFLSAMRNTLRLDNFHGASLQFLLVCSLQH